MQRIAFYFFAQLEHLSRPLLAISDFVARGKQERTP